MIGLESLMNYNTDYRILVILLNLFISLAVINAF